MNPDKWLVRMRGYRADRFYAVMLAAHLAGAASYARAFGGARIAPVMLGGRVGVIFLAEPEEEEEEPEEPEEPGEGEGEGEGGGGG